MCSRNPAGTGTRARTKRSSTASPASTTVGDISRSIAPRPRRTRSSKARTANAEVMVAAVDAIYMMPSPATARTPSWPHFAESASPTMIIETTAIPMPRPVSTRTWRSTASTSTPKPLAPSARRTRISRPTLIAMAASWRTSSGTITIEKIVANRPLVSDTSWTSNTMPTSAPVSHGSTNSSAVCIPARRRR